MTDVAQDCIFISHYYSVVIISGGNSDDGSGDGTNSNNSSNNNNTGVKCRSWAGPERGSEILCVLTHGMGSTPPPPPRY